MSQLNETLSRLIDTIRKCGGDVIKFAGDAILVVWLSSTQVSWRINIWFEIIYSLSFFLFAPNSLYQQEMQVAAIRAAQCALECTHMKQASGLGLHVGIGCGELVAAHVGGTEGWNGLGIV